jgi:hypothetical protein
MGTGLEKDALYLISCCVAAAPPNARDTTGVLLRVLPAASVSLDLAGNKASSTDKVVVDDVGCLYSGDGLIGGYRASLATGDASFITAAADVGQQDTSQTTARQRRPDRDGARHQWQLEPPATSWCPWRQCCADRRPTAKCRCSS